MSSEGRVTNLASGKRCNGDCGKGCRLSLKQVHWLAHVGYSEVPSQCRMALCDGFIHRVGNVSVGEVSRLARAQFADVNSLGEVHLKQRSLAEAQWNDVLRLLFG